MNARELVKLDADLSAQLRLPPGQHRLWQGMVFLAHSGDSWFWLAGLFLVWLISWDSVWHTRAALMAAGVVALAVAVLAIKFMVRRQRPPGEWGAIYRNTDPHSFPSGHAARAFLLAVVAMGMGPLWFGLLLVFWAPLVSIARVATGVHYLSDVVAGMLIGILGGWLTLLARPLLFGLFPFIFGG